jgi:chromosome segregation ATPase
LSEYSEQERRRYAIFSEFYSCELEWAGIRVMNENEFKKLQDNVASLEKEIILLKNQQPDCRRLLGLYDEEFSKYSEEVETILQVNNHERYQLHGCLFSKEKIESLRSTLAALRKLRNEYFDYDGSTIQYSSRVLWNLISLKNEVETDKSQFFQSLEKIGETLENNNSVLYELLQPTHDWVILESPKKKRCAKCSKEVETEQKQPEHSSKEIETRSSIDDEHRKRIQRFRDSEIL